jgi:hypothetical protein
MQVAAERLVTVADGIDTAACEVAPTVLDDALAAVSAALPEAECASVASRLVDSLGGQLRTWCDDLGGWAERARACAAAYDEVDARVQTRLTQVPV